MNRKNPPDAILREVVRAHRRQAVPEHRGRDQPRRARRDVRPLQARRGPAPPAKGEQSHDARMLAATMCAWPCALRRPRTRRSRIPIAPVKIVVPFTPGTGIDILARTLGQKLSDDWKQPVVVENRAGASGNIGTEAVAKSPPGRLHAADDREHDRAEPEPVQDDSVRPVKDFVAVAPLALGRLALVAHPSLPAKTVKELVALAKASPGKLNYASPGNGTPHHLRDGALQVEGRHRRRARAVQGNRASRAGPPRRAGERDVPAGARRAAAGGRRQARHARGRGRRARERHAQRAVARRGRRRARDRHRHLVRPVRAGPYARRRSSTASTPTSIACSRCPTSSTRSRSRACKPPAARPPRSTAHANRISSGGRPSCASAKIQPD